MKKKIELFNDYGSVHVKTKIGEVDGDQNEGKCMHCSLEVECSIRKISCADGFLYRVKDHNIMRDVL
ncbi:MAG: hypothetical protein ACRCZ0_01170 [Cetobacterium sp.]